MSAPDTNPLVVSESDIQAFLRARGTSWWFVRLAYAVRNWFALQRYHLLFLFLSHPVCLAMMRYGAASVRYLQPTPVLGQLIVPLRDAVLREALLRTRTFNAAEAMSPRLPAGEVILGIDWERRHAEERHWVERGLTCNGAERHDALRMVVRAAVQQHLPTDRRLASINVARDVCENVALIVATEYMGVRHEGDDRHLREMIRKLASQVFQAPVVASREEAFARIASDRMLHLIMAQVRAAAERLDGNCEPTVEMTLLERYVCLSNRPDSPNWLTPEWVGRNVMTLVIFGTATTARAMSHALYRLFRLHGARDAAAVASFHYAGLIANASKDDPGHAGATDRSRRHLRAVVFEALRWHPMLSMLSVRAALRPTTLGTPEGGQTPVAAGQNVLPLLLAALHDPERFPEPEKFDAKRCPCTDRLHEHYLHFGFGPHACPGREISEIQFEETLHAIMQHPEIVGGQPVRTDSLRYDGPAVVDLRIRPRIQDRS